MVEKGEVEGLPAILRLVNIGRAEVERNRDIWSFFASSATWSVSSFLDGHESSLVLA
jgi:hypothetical protein